MTIVDDIKRGSENGNGIDMYTMRTCIYILALSIYIGATKNGVKVGKVRKITNGTCKYNILA